MKTELSAECCICGVVVPESEGSYSAPAYDGEDGAFFVCNGCRMEADADTPEEIPEWMYEEDRYENKQESDDKSDYPRD